jgi:hypothetical protein
MDDPAVGTDARAAEANSHTTRGPDVAGDTDAAVGVGERRFEGQQRNCEHGSGESRNQSG